MFCRKINVWIYKNMWKGIVMNPEQIKIREFFKKLYSIDYKNWAAWFMLGLCVLFMLIGCVGPVQAYMEAKDSSDTIMLVILAYVGPFIAYMRIQPYTMYMENQKKRTFFELVKYYPVDKKEIKKMKTEYMIKFLVKLLPFCMLAQIPATLYDYGAVSIINFLYIIVVAFIWPVICGLAFIWLEQ